MPQHGDVRTERGPRGWGRLRFVFCAECGSWVAHGDVGSDEALSAHEWLVHVLIAS
jgi:hypothetical protein